MLKSTHKKKSDAKRSGEIGPRIKSYRVLKHEGKYGLFVLYK